MTCAKWGSRWRPGRNDILFEDEIGYRIPRDAYALPEVSFDSEELAVLGLAARAWQQATLADAAARAVQKLEAAGIDVDSQALCGHRASRGCRRTRLRTAVRGACSSDVRSASTTHRWLRLSPRDATSSLGGWRRGTAVGTS